MKLLIIKRTLNSESIKADFYLVDTDTKLSLKVNEHIILLSKVLKNGLWGRCGYVYGGKYGMFETSCNNTFNKTWSIEHQKAYEKIGKIQEGLYIVKNLLQDIIESEYIFID